MTETGDNRGVDTLTATGSAAGWECVTALQTRLRSLFQNRAVNRAVAEALGCIADRFDAVHAAVHARMGVNLLSEEWTRSGATTSLELRESVNEVVWEAMCDQTARCTRIGDGADAVTVLSAVMYDGDAEQSGGAAIVLAGEREDTEELLAQFVGIVGYLALLVGGDASRAASVAERRDVRPTAVAGDPVRLAFEMVAEIANRHRFETAAIGYVRRSGVEVVAISGIDDVRSANPGVRLIRAAMEECLDREDIIVYAGPRETLGDDGEDDARLHEQWSRALCGDTVASVPLVLSEEVVAVIALSKGAAPNLDRDKALTVAEEMTGYAALVPLSQAASRGLLAHAVESARSFRRRVIARGWRKVALLTALPVAVFGWLMFGQMRYSFTVPCTIAAAERRTISCPREGILAELFVRPGDRVRTGQLLATLDANDDLLRRTELRAEIESVQALADSALEERDAGQLRIQEARRESLIAQLAVVDANLERAQVRSPQSGVVLRGDLRESLGSRLAMGEPLFEVARYDRAVVVLEIPEQLVLLAHECQSAEFAPRARPDQTFELDGVRVAPASTVQDAKNVFLGEAVIAANLDTLAPGMEGVVYIDVGHRSAWWVLTHRVTDWLHLNLWL